MQKFIVCFRLNRFDLKDLPWDSWLWLLRGFECVGPINYMAMCIGYVGVGYVGIGVLATWILALGILARWVLASLQKKYLNITQSIFEKRRFENMPI